MVLLSLFLGNNFCANDEKENKETSSKVVHASIEDIDFSDIKSSGILSARADQEKELLAISSDDKLILISSIKQFYREKPSDDDKDNKKTDEEKKDNKNSNKENNEKTKKTKGNNDKNTEKNTEGNAGVSEINLNPTELIISPTYYSALNDFLESDLTKENVTEFLKENDIKFDAAKLEKAASSDKKDDLERFFLNTVGFKKFDLDLSKMTFEKNSQNLLEFITVGVDKKQKLSQIKITVDENGKFKIDSSSGSAWTSWYAVVGYIIIAILVLVIIMKWCVGGSN